MTVATAPVSRAVDRARAAVCCLALTAAVFAQAPGTIAGDTKLDLVEDPWRFLGRALHLWTPQAYLGGVQNQAYGYLFPMGPFFGVGESIGLPGWVVQRAWQALLLCTALLGMRWLLTRLGIGTPATRLLGGIAYALTPLILSKLGPISSEALPECVAPLVLAPLVGPWPVRKPRRAAAVSGLAVLLAGGINAAATVAILLLPALWLISRPAGRERRRLCGWWVLSVALASLWWVVGLVAIARTAAPFLDWIESASTTTATTSVANTLAGTSGWLAHLPLSLGSTWAAGRTLSATPLSVFDSLAIVGMGVVGLCLSGLRHRRFWVSALLIGVTLLSAAWIGPAGPPFATTAQHLLDGTLVAFRNISKLDPVFRIPLVVGLVYAMTALAHRRPAAAAPKPPAFATVTASPVAALTAVALVGLVAPFWRQTVEPSGSFTTIPSWWSQTANWLETHGIAGDRALLLPAAGHPDYLWGRPTDEPLQTLTSTNWVTRDIVPLGGAGEARLLDAVTDQLASGRGSPALAGLLARSGIDLVVVRDDLDPTAQLITPPAVVRAALVDSPGIVPVAGFGPLQRLGAGQARVPMIQIFRVSGAGPPAELMPAADAVTVAGGGPESILPLLADGLIDNRMATVMAANEPGSPAATVPSPTLATDGYRRREVDFGEGINNSSATLTPTEPFTQTRPEHDYLFAAAAGQQTVAEQAGVRSVTASSAADDATAFFVRGAGHSANAAFDHNLATTWISGGIRAVGQWVREDFESPTTLSYVQVRVPQHPAGGDPVTRVTVRTAAGAASAPLAPPGEMTDIAVPVGSTTWVQVTADAVQGGGAGQLASFEVIVPGSPPAVRFLRLPGILPAPGGDLRGVGFAPASDVGTGCLHPLDGSQVCDPSLITSVEDAAGIDRRFELRAPENFRISATARPRGGPALDRMLQSGLPLRAAVSSRLVHDPGGGAAAMLDGNVNTAWTAAPFDRNPTVAVTLDRPRRITGVSLLSPARLAVSAPEVARIRVGSSTETVRVRHGVAALKRPLVGKQVVITFPKLALRGSLVAGIRRNDPVGIAELRLEVEGSARASGATPRSLLFPASRGPAESRKQKTACGAGPALNVDGDTIRTALSGVPEQLITGGDWTVRPCGGPRADELPLGAGAHQISFDGNRLAAPDSLVLGATGDGATDISANSGTRMATIGQWGSTLRTVAVGPGAAQWLVVHENANPGWVATLDGHRLDSQVIDGWQQGYLVPAGAAGVIRLTFAPDSSYRWGLLVGGVAALLLVPMALLFEREKYVVSRAASRRRSRWLAGCLPIATLPLLGGLAGLAALVIAAGVAALGWVTGRRWSVAALAGTVMAIAAGIAAVGASSATGLTHAGTEALQLSCLLALAAVAVSLARSTEDEAGVGSAGRGGSASQPPPQPKRR